MSRVLVACLALVLSACATANTATSQARQNRPLTILISIDGFHPDYLMRGATPTLSALAAEGATGVMRPSFPSVTFPNHYTLVTGLHPDHHGIVGNAFVDPVLGRFSMASKEAGWWDQAEPVWVTAEKAGLTAATMFWPGSETEIRGVRPTHWSPFDQTLTGDARVDRLLEWLDGPTPPDLATLYFDIVDTAGHANGPGAEATTAAATAVDASIGRLMQGLEARGLEDRVNLVVVSDHGMAATAPERAIYLDDLIEASALQVIYAGAVAYLDAAPGREAEVEAALVRRHPHAECWTRATIPARLVLGTNPRVSSIVCSADTGWLLATRARPVTRSGGAHGYDNAASEMSALFIAHGPAIRRGVILNDLDSVDVQPLLGRMLGIAVPAGDGRAADTLPAMTQ
ncbi:MAG: ectonucleotide pyrophosphatase/phosphodiesterase [Brevundimonas sp.]|uniref:alkaline phosphatase family protein n=1 Tax=Brevundimonas sp. TaxID=1871086 RepID=UPI0027373AD3|nr:ectonucleotide pyrophosphatase/phosphodiesterase [Brevundimonas sp.]MDP3406066.1 ectonucleotide pyrophosphatase/phosphodiesterase [Brevundimonas sp.]